MSKKISIFPVENATEEERLYFKLIDDAFEDGKKERFSNSRPEHAVYLLYKLIDGAKESVRIFSGNLARDFRGVLAYGEPKVAEAAVAFLQKEGSKLSIITVEDLDVDQDHGLLDHPMLAQISESEIRGELVLAKGSQEDWNAFKYHFIVVDDQALRVEYDTKDAKAFVNFGDSELAKSLGEIFDVFLRNSEEKLRLPA